MKSPINPESRLSFHMSAANATLNRAACSRQREHGITLFWTWVTVVLLATADPHWASAAGPEVSSLFPAGGQRGTTVEVFAGGKFPNWPAQAWVDRPGLTISPASDKGKLSVAIAPDAAPGLYWIRLHDAEGAAPPQPFVVGTLPEFVETESNNAPHKAQATPSSTVVANGRLAVGGDVDHFAVSLAKGQTLVASLAGHETLGSPMDAVMHVVLPAGGQLAYNHDQRGLDPEIIFTAPADGNYLVRVFGFPSTPDSSIAFAGGDRYLYRVTLTTGGFVDYAWPLAVTRDRETRVELEGWNIPESLRVITIKPEGDSFEIADPQLAGVAVVAVEPHDTLVESEPNEPASPQAIALPVTMTGRIGRPGDVDAFSFDGKQGQPLVFQLESRALGYPLDAVLEATDGAGKSLARVDDVTSARDPFLTFSPPADGSFRVLVSDLNRQGSSRQVYRLRARPAKPSYEVTADTHAYIATPDKPAEITLSVDRQNGFAEEIGFTVTGLPDSIAAAQVTSTASGDSAKAVKLSLTTRGGPFSGPIRIHAEANGTSKLTRTATTAIPNHTARTALLWLTATAAKK